MEKFSKSFVVLCVGLHLIQSGDGDLATNPFLKSLGNPAKQSSPQLQQVQRRLAAPIFPKGKANFVTPSNAAQIFYPEDIDYDSCLFNGDPARPGVCKNFLECPPAIRNWKKFRQSPQRCYFEGFIEFVCCEEQKVEPINPFPTPPPHPVPLITSQKKTQPRRSEEECDEYNIPWFGITNGEAALPDEFPFMAALGWTSAFTEEISYLCGGVLISRRYLLTAAHCTKVNGDAPKVARLGGGPLKGTNDEDNFPIKRIISHSGYDGEAVYNDIALIELADETYRFKPACLWLESNYPTQNVTAIGYGHTQFGGPSSKILLKGDVFLIPNNECSAFYPKNGEDFRQGLVDSQICAGDSRNRRDTCQGDSGGPLVMKFEKDITRNPYNYVVGLTSVGQACGGITPSIYTKVARYIDWIEDIVWPTTSSVNVVQVRQDEPSGKP